MNIKYFESFSTVDQCVSYLESIGCVWNYEKETKLKENWIYIYKDIAVLYDPYELLSIDK